MKSMMLLMSLLMSHAALSEEITCLVSLNTVNVAEPTFTIGSSERLLFASAEDYVFYISNKGQSEFELEVFNPDEPSRSYALGFLKTKADKLGWSLWSRNVLLETSCKLTEQ